MLEFLNLILLIVNLILYIPHFKRYYYKSFYQIEKKIYNNILLYLTYLSKQKVIPTKGKKKLNSEQKSWNSHHPTTGDEVVILNLNSNLNVGNIYRSSCCLGIKRYHIFGKKIYLPSSQVGYDFIPIKYYENIFPHIRDRNNEKTLLEFNKNELDKFMELKKDMNIYLVEQGGQNINTIKLNKLKNNLIIFGNETFGIPKPMMDYLKVKYNAKVISVPQIGIGKSLNVSNCASIVLYDFMKKNIEQLSY